MNDMTQERRGGHEESEGDGGSRSERQTHLVTSQQKSGWQDIRRSIGERKWASGEQRALNEEK